MQPTRKKQWQRRNVIFSIRNAKTMMEDLNIGFSLTWAVITSQLEETPALVSKVSPNLSSMQVLHCKRSISSSEIMIIPTNVNHLFINIE